jgi:hypothetical protein
MLYFNTTTDDMKVYEGSSWVNAYASLSGALLATNNLSDLNNAGTARTNLGLGTAATTAASDYATAAQADQTVALTGAGATSISGTYPNFTITSTDTNTTYSVGDGGLTQNNFTDALKTKLDGVATNANNYTLPFTDNSSNWDTAFGWGNHASAGYLTSFDITTQTDTKYLRSNAADTAANRITFTDGISLEPNDGIRFGGTADVHLRALTQNANSAIDLSSGSLSIGGLGNTVWHAGNDGSGSGLDADLLDGDHKSALYRKVSTANGTAGAGWITVAECTSSRYHGEVFVTDGESGDHSFIRIDWMRSYVDTAFTVLNCGGHANRITGVRVLQETADPTYGTKKLQVYVTTSSNYFVRIHSTGEVSYYNDFTAVTPVVQNSITGYAVQGATIDELDDNTLATHQGLRSGNGCDIRWSANSNTAKARFINEDGLNDTWIGIGGYNGVNRIESGYGFSGGSSDLMVYGGMAGELARITTGSKIGLNQSSPTYYVDTYFPVSTSTQYIWRFTGTYSGAQCRAYYGTFFIGNASTSGHGLGFGSTSIFPAEADNFGFNNDNVMDLGNSSARWDDVYATNGTIQTSDEREKQDIEALSDAEQRVAIAAKGLLRKFRWKDAVEEKGDNARTHFGIIAQDLQAAFEAEGLDYSKYAMFIKSEWWIGDKTHPAIESQLDDEGNVIVEGSPEHIETGHRYDNEADAPSDATYHYRLGIRYSELLAFIIASI